MENETEAGCQASLGRWVWIIHRHSQVYIDNQLEKFGFGSGQVRFLMELSRADGINQEQLSERLEVDKATTARAVKKLMELGYIERVRDQQDHRVYRLHLSKKGRDLLPLVREEMQGLTRRLARDFSDEERVQTLDLLRRMTTNICKARAGDQDE